MNPSALHTFYAVAFSDYMQAVQFATDMFAVMGEDESDTERPIMFIDRQRTFANTDACGHLRVLRPDIAIEAVGVHIRALPDGLAMLLGQQDDVELYRNKDAVK